MTTAIITVLLLTPNNYVHTSNKYLLSIHVLDLPLSFVVENWRFIVASHSVDI